MSTTTDPADEMARLRARVAAELEANAAYARQYRPGGAARPNGIRVGVMKRAAYQALPVVERMTFARNGGKIIN